MFTTGEFVQHYPKLRVPMRPRIHKAKRRSKKGIRRGGKRRAKNFRVGGYGRRRILPPIVQRSKFVKLAVCLRFTQGITGGVVLTDEDQITGNSILNVIGSTDLLGSTAYAAFYEKYVVLASRISGRVFNNSTVVTEDIYAYIFPSDNNTALSDTSQWSAICDIPQIKIWRISPLTTSNGQNNLRYVKHYSTMKRQLRKRVANDQTVIADTNAVPSTNWFWHVGCTQRAATVPTTTGKIEWMIKFEVYVKFFDRKANIA